MFTHIKITSKKKVFKIDIATGDNSDADINGVNSEVNSDIPLPISDKQSRVTPARGLCIEYNGINSSTKSNGDNCSGDESIVDGIHHNDEVKEKANSKRRGVEVEGSECDTIDGDDYDNPVVVVGKEKSSSEELYENVAGNGKEVPSAHEETRVNRENAECERARSFCDLGNDSGKVNAVDCDVNVNGSEGIEDGQICIENTEEGVESGDLNFMDGEVCVEKRDAIIEDKGVIVRNNNVNIKNKCINIEYGGVISDSKCEIGKDRGILTEDIDVVIEKESVNIEDSGVISRNKGEVSEYGGVDNKNGDVVCENGVEIIEDNIDEVQKDKHQISNDVVVHKINSDNIDCHNDTDSLWNPNISHASLSNDLTPDGLQVKDKRGLSPIRYIGENGTVASIGVEHETTGSSELINCDSPTTALSPGKNTSQTPSRGKRYKYPRNINSHKKTGDSGGSKGMHKRYRRVDGDESAENQHRRYHHHQYRRRSACVYPKAEEHRFQKTPKMSSEKRFNTATNHSRSQSYKSKYWRYHTPSNDGGLMPKSTKHDDGGSSHKRNLRNRGNTNNYNNNNKRAVGTRRNSCSGDNRRFASKRRRNAPASLPVARYSAAAGRSREKSSFKNRSTHRPTGRVRRELYVVCREEEEEEPESSVAVERQLYRTCDDTDTRIVVDAGCILRDNRRKSDELRRDYELASKAIVARLYKSIHYMSHQEKVFKENFTKIVTEFTIQIDFMISVNMAFYAKPIEMNNALNNNALNLDFTFFKGMERENLKQDTEEIEVPVYNDINHLPFIDTRCLISISEQELIYLHFKNAYLKAQFQEKAASTAGHPSYGYFSIINQINCLIFYEKDDQLDDSYNSIIQKLLSETNLDNYTCYADDVYHLLEYLVRELAERGSPGGELLRYRLLVAATFCTAEKLANDPWYHYDKAMQELPTYLIFRFVMSRCITPYDYHNTYMKGLDYLVKQAQYNNQLQVGGDQLWESYPTVADAPSTSFGFSEKQQQQRQIKQELQEHVLTSVSLGSDWSVDGALSRRTGFKEESGVHSRSQRATEMILRHSGEVKVEGGGGVFPPPPPPLYVVEAEGRKWSIPEGIGGGGVGSREYAQIDSRTDEIRYTNTGCSKGYKDSSRDVWSPSLNRRPAVDRGKGRRDFDRKVFAKVGEDRMVYRVLDRDDYSPYRNYGKRDLQGRKRSLPSPQYNLDNRYRSRRHKINTNMQHKLLARESRSPSRSSETYRRNRNPSRNSGRSRRSRSNTRKRSRYQENNSRDGHTSRRRNRNERDFLDYEDDGFDYCETSRKTRNRDNSKRDYISGERSSKDRRNSGHNYIDGSTKDIREIDRDFLDHYKQTSHYYDDRRCSTNDDRKPSIGNGALGVVSYSDREVRGDSIADRDVRGDSMTGSQVRGDSLEGSEVRGDSMTGKEVRGDSPFIGDELAQFNDTLYTGDQSNWARQLEPSSTRQPDEPYYDNPEGTGLATNSRADYKDSVTLNARGEDLLFNDDNAIARTYLPTFDGYKIRRCSWEEDDEVMEARSNRDGMDTGKDMAYDQSYVNECNEYARGGRASERLANLDEQFDVGLRDDNAIITDNAQSSYTSNVYTSGDGRGCNNEYHSADTGINRRQAAEGGSLKGTGVKPTMSEDRALKFQEWKRDINNEWATGNEIGNTGDDCYGTSTEILRSLPVAEDGKVFFETRQQEAIGTIGHDYGDEILPSVDAVSNGYPSLAPGGVSNGMFYGVEIKEKDEEENVFVKRENDALLGGYDVETAGHAIYNDTPGDPDEILRRNGILDIVESDGDYSRSPRTGEHEREADPSEDLRSMLKMKNSRREAMLHRVVTLSDQRRMWTGVQLDAFAQENEAALRSQELMQPGGLQRQAAGQEVTGDNSSKEYRGDSEAYPYTAQHYKNEFSVQILKLILARIERYMISGNSKYALKHLEKMMVVPHSEKLAVLTVRDRNLLGYVYADIQMTREHPTKPRKCLDNVTEIWNMNLKGFRIPPLMLEAVKKFYKFLLNLPLGNVVCDADNPSHLYPMYALMVEMELRISKSLLYKIIVSEHILKNKGNYLILLRALEYHFKAFSSYNFNDLIQEFKNDPKFIADYVLVELKYESTTRGLQFIQEYARSFFPDKIKIHNVYIQLLFRQILALDPVNKDFGRIDLTGIVNVYTWLCFILYCENVDAIHARSYFESAISIFHNQTEELQILYKEYISFLIRMKYEYSYIIQVYGEAIFSVPTYRNLSYLELDENHCVTTWRNNYSFHNEITLLLADNLPADSSYDFLVNVIEMEHMKASEVIYHRYLSDMYKFKRVGNIYGSRFPFSLAIWQIRLKNLNFRDIKKMSLMINQACKCIPFCAVFLKIKMFFDRIIQGKYGIDQCKKIASEYGINIHL